MDRPLFIDDRVDILVGDLSGETGTVVDWSYQSLSYRHSEFDKRLYWVEIDGDPSTRVPFLPEQLFAERAVAA